MKELFYFIITFVIIYGLYLLLVVLRKKGLAKFENSTEVLYLQKKYQIHLKKISIKSLANTVALANSFLVSLVVFLVSVIDSFILKIIIAALIMIPMILLLYHFIGTHYKKKETK